MCGFFGMIGKKSVVEYIYQGLIQLQHRGQDSAGIFAFDPKTNQSACHKDLGLVKNIFDSTTLPLPYASWGIGHVRYSTIGKGRVLDAQPFYANNRYTVAMAHNGNIVNYVHLQRKLLEEGISLKSHCDVEVILHTFLKHLSTKEFSFENLCSAVHSVHEEVIGSYSVVALIEGQGLLAFRDPQGIRPMLMGSSPDRTSYAFASETNALVVAGCTEITNVRAGEAVFIDKNFEVHKQEVCYRRPAHCCFEYNYFSKPNTSIDHSEVYSVRSHLGESLAEKIGSANIKPDVVIPIPSTARPTAISLARKLDIPYEEGFVKQDVGRTFIMPTQGIREKALTQKLAPVSSVFQDKEVLLVDDSIVRGTVSKRVIALARWAGAKKVYFASTFPAIKHGCLYGVDFPTTDQLIAHQSSIHQIREEIGADLLFYNDPQAVFEAVGHDNLCTACFTGNYPSNVSGMDELQKMRKIHLEELELTCQHW